MKNRIALTFLTIIMVLALAGCSSKMDLSAEPSINNPSSLSNSSRSEDDLVNSGELEGAAQAKIDYENITMDRTKPILPSAKISCLSAFEKHDGTKGLTLTFIRLSDDEKYLFIEAIDNEGKNQYFQYDITANLIYEIDPHEPTLLVLWKNCYNNDVIEGKAIASRVLNDFNSANLNTSLYHTMLTLLPFRLTEENIDSVKRPTVCVFPFKNYYCIRFDYVEEDIGYTYQIFCDYEDNVLEKQACCFSMSEIKTEYFGDLEECMDENLLTVWSDEKIYFTGEVTISPEGMYYLKIDETNIVLIEHFERFNGCNCIIFHDDLPEYVGMTITVGGYINHYRDGGSLYLEEIEIMD